MDEACWAATCCHCKVPSRPRRYLVLSKLSINSTMTWKSMGWHTLTKQGSGWVDGSRDGCRGLELTGEQQLAAWRIGFGTSMIPGVQFAACQNKRLLVSHCHTRRAQLRCLISKTRQSQPDWCLKGCLCLLSPTDVAEESD